MLRTHILATGQYEMYSASKSMYSKYTEYE